MTWTYELDGDGAYVITRDGAPAALVALSETVPHHRLRMQHIVEAFAAVDVLAARLVARADAFDDGDDDEGAC